MSLLDIQRKLRDALITKLRQRKICCGLTSCKYYPTTYSYGYLYYYLFVNCFVKICCAFESNRLFNSDANNCLIISSQDSGHFYRFQSTGTECNKIIKSNFFTLISSQSALNCPAPVINTATRSFKSMNQNNMQTNKPSETILPEDLTVHAAHITEVHNVPLRILIRPIPSILDEQKVRSLMETIESEEAQNTVPPIDILWITGRQGGDYYYSFGGCHRYEAYKRLKRETIPCKLFKSTVEDLKSYLGSSTPDLL